MLVAKFCTKCGMRMVKTIGSITYSSEDGSKIEHPIWICPKRWKFLGVFSGHGKENEDGYDPDLEASGYY